MIKHNLIYIFSTIKVGMKISKIVKCYIVLQVVELL